MTTINAYLALQEFADGRVMFKRIAIDASGEQVTAPGGIYQKQTMHAFEWLHKHGMPTVQKNGNITASGLPMNCSEPFEVIQQ